MNVVPNLRLGGSFASLKAHSFFKNFDWDDLFNKKIKPPFIPPEENLIS